MLDNLFYLLPKKEALGFLKEFLSKAEEVLEIFENQYMKDGNIRNAAIDTLIDLLEGLKDYDDEGATVAPEPSSRK